MYTFYFLIQLLYLSKKKDPLVQNFILQVSSMPQYAKEEERERERDDDDDASI